MSITLKAARINAGLTQAEIAEKVGVSKPTYKKWEQGTSEPKVSQFKQLCDALRVAPDDIILPAS